MAITLEETLNAVYKGFANANVNVDGHSVTGTVKVVIPPLEIEADVDLGQWKGIKIEDFDRSEKQKLDLINKIVEKAQEVFGKLDEDLKALKSTLKKLRVKLGFKIELIVSIEFSIELTIEVKQKRLGVA